MLEALTIIVSVSNVYKRIFSRIFYRCPQRRLVQTYAIFRIKTPALPLSYSFSSLCNRLIKSFALLIYFRIRNNCRNNRQRYQTKTQKNSRRYMKFAAQTIISCKYCSFLLLLMVKSITLHTRWQPIDMTKTSSTI
jgi:hypothetical protein